MIRRNTTTKKRVSDRASIKKRVQRFYEAFNRSNWQQCFSFIDPKLREREKVNLANYAGLLDEFKHHYGAIAIWYIRINLHLDTRENKHGGGPFAFVYVVWQDEQQAFHMFQERWVKHGGRWYTRVVGLVTNKEPMRSAS